MRLLPVEGRLPRAGAASGGGWDVEKKKKKRRRRRRAATSKERAGLVLLLLVGFPRPLSATCFARQAREDGASAERAC